MVTSESLLTNRTSTSEAGPRLTSLTRKPTAGLHDRNVTKPERHAATTLPPREASVRTTVGADDVVCVADGRGELDPVGVGVGVGFGLSVECFFECFLVDFELVGLAEGLASSGELVAKRAVTSLALRTGIDAGVTALPTICTAIQPLVMATAAKTIQRATTPPR